MRAWGPSPNTYDCNSTMAALCEEDGNLEQARALFGDMIEGGCEPDVSSFNIMIAASLKAEDYPAANDLMADMQGRGLHLNAKTYLVLIENLSRLGMMTEAKSLFERMKAAGIAPQPAVYDSLLKGFRAEGNINGMVELLRKMGEEGVDALDDELTSTILTCICDLPEGHNIPQIEPRPSREKKSVCSVALRLMSC